MAKFRVVVTEVRKVKTTIEICDTHYEKAVYKVVKEGAGKVIKVETVDSAWQDRLLIRFEEIYCTFDDYGIDWFGNGEYEFKGMIWVRTDKPTIDSRYVTEKMLIKK